MNIFRLSAVLLALLLSSFASADEASAQKLNALLSKAQSFSANFEQVIVDGGGNNMQKTSGELTVKRPGLFYWRTHKPYQQLLVSDGKQTWFYDIDLEQVTVRKTDQRLTNTPALLLSGDVKELTSSFGIKENKLADQFTIFELTPLSKDKAFEMMLMGFENGQLAEMRLQDSLGQITRLEFSDVKQNPSVDEKLFHFTPPEGVDVMTE